MTAFDLYIRLGLGLLAVLASVAVGAGAYRIPRVWKAAMQARCWPSVVWLITASVMVWLLLSPHWGPHVPGWEFDPICLPNTSHCGWNYYYVIVIGALQLLGLAALVLASIAAAAVLRSIRAWLDNPIGADWDNVTNRQRLRRRWRIWRRERRLTRSLAVQLAAEGAVDVSIERYRELLPMMATTSFRFDPPLDCLDELAATLSGDLLIEFVDVYREAWACYLHAHWDLTKLDYLPAFHAAQWSRAAGVLGDWGRRLVSAMPGASRRREHEAVKTE